MTMGGLCQWRRCLVSKGGRLRRRHQFRQRQQRPHRLLPLFRTQAPALGNPVLTPRIAGRSGAIVARAATTVMQTQLGQRMLVLGHRFCQRQQRPHRLLPLFRTQALALGRLVWTPRFAGRSGAIVARAAATVMQIQLGQRMLVLGRCPRR
jgi:demethoxyubiquinone hydroxylase (CLK1/Coq7/Cat5 family)